VICALLKGTSADEVIRHMKSIFARHGIPELVLSDNSPQFSAESYAQFAKEYNFKHVTSSTYYLQGNGEAERAVGTVKNLLKKEKDSYLALLSYRSTPDIVHRNYS
jgi:transposase InsO family protein